MEIPSESSVSGKPDELQSKDDEKLSKTDLPRLSSDFFSKLVHQPDCITKGICNGCGRCEH